MDISGKTWTGKTSLCWVETHKLGQNFWAILSTQNKIFHIIRVQWTRLDSSGPTLCPEEPKSGIIWCGEKGMNRRFFLGTIWYLKKFRQNSMSDFYRVSRLNSRVIVKSVFLFSLISLFLIDWKVKNDSRFWSEVKRPALIGRWFGQA